MDGTLIVVVGTECCREGVKDVWSSTEEEDGEGKGEGEREGEREGEARRTATRPDTDPSLDLLDHPTARFKKHRSDPGL